MALSQKTCLLAILPFYASPVTLVPDLCFTERLQQPRSPFLPVLSSLGHPLPRQITVLTGINAVA